jgi:hypothetical protein
MFSSTRKSPSQARWRRFHGTIYLPFCSRRARTHTPFPPGTKSNMSPVLSSEHARETPIPISAPAESVNLRWALVAGGPAFRLRPFHNWPLPPPNNTTEAVDPGVLTQLLRVPHSSPLSRRVRVLLWSSLVSSVLLISRKNSSRESPTFRKPRKLGHPKILEQD